MFVGSGAPKGKELEIPGRHDTDQIFIGIEWLESIHFGHVESVGRRVLIIGVGNTAMDCCRSAKRLGATDVKVIARKTRKYFKASPWELEDAEEERVDILENLQPVRFVIDNGTLTGMEFDRFSRSRRTAGSTRRSSAARSSPATLSSSPSARTTPFRSSSATMRLEFGKWDMPLVDKTDLHARPARESFSAAMRRSAGQHHLAVEHGHQAAISIHQSARACRSTNGPRPG